MPGGNGTGPLGLGPMTGRGMGYCVLKLPEGGGTARGFAGVAGRPVGVGALGEWEIGLLKGMVDSLERQLQGIYARIGDLERRGG